MARVYNNLIKPSRNKIMNGSMFVDYTNLPFGFPNSAQNNNSGFMYIPKWQFRYVHNGSFIPRLSTAEFEPFGAGSNYISVKPTQGTNYLTLSQYIHPYQILDLDWGQGSSNQKSLTLSFWVRCGQMGTYGGSLTGAVYYYDDVDTGDITFFSTASYPFSYTINQANVWEKKTITISPDNTGRPPSPARAFLLGEWWQSGLTLNFCIMADAQYKTSTAGWVRRPFGDGIPYLAPASTSAVDFGIELNLTQVQLEVGSSATEYEYIDRVEELSRCLYFGRRIGAGAVGQLSGASNSQASMAISGVKMAHSNSGLVSKVAGAINSVGQTYTITSGYAGPNFAQLNITPSGTSNRIVFGGAVDFAWIQADTTFWNILNVGER